MPSSLPFCSSSFPCYEEAAELSRKPAAALVRRGIDRGGLRLMQAERVAIAIAALCEGLALRRMVNPDATQ